MSPQDRKILFTALAFTSVVQNPALAADKEQTSRILRLSALLDQFCRDYAPDHAPQTDGTTVSRAETTP